MSQLLAKSAPVLVYCGLNNFSLRAQQLGRASNCQIVGRSPRSEIAKDREHGGETGSAGPYEQYDLLKHASVHLSSPK
jgi:hypothetical protein